MNFKEFLRLYFTFSRSERRALRFLLTLIVFIVLANVLMPVLIQPKQWDHTPYQAMLDSVSKAISYKDSLFYTNRNIRKNVFPDYPKNSYSRAVIKLKPFNPNDLDEAGWQQLGLSEKQAATVVNIRSRKGGFKNTEDLKRVKFISEYVMQRIEPYLVFPVDTQQAGQTEIKPAELKVAKTLDINQAVLEEWVELPGIGDKLAERILAYRQKLGGFHQTAQVCEVYGMPVETCDKIMSRLTISRSEVTKIQLNYASIREFASHPYISFKLGSAIVSQRNARGFYKSVDEILTLGLVEKELYDKIAPYLTVQ